VRVDQFYNKKSHSSTSLFKTAPADII